MASFHILHGISTAIRNPVTSRRLVAIDVSIAAVGYSGNSKISYKKCIVWLQQALYISTANETKYRWQECGGKLDKRFTL